MLTRARIYFQRDPLPNETGICNSKGDVILRKLRDAEKHAALFIEMAGGTVTAILYTIRDILVKVKA